MCAPTGMPILWALASPKIGEREVLASMLQVEAGVVAGHDGILLISDKGFASQPFEKRLAEQGIELLRPSRKPERARHGEAILTKIRQLIESVNDIASFPTDDAHHADLWQWVAGFGQLAQAGVEGTGSYGYRLAQFLTGRGITVFEVN
ncbi:hypothetical protein [Salinispora sp. H7-4]|uniref:hypothetical protein n=1 Tax=Salinispora sp. H7-4 TaxID=2748321 RepID=UPI002102EBBD|nr:hypothetical protein [Salinispora sp. H7-4]